MAQITAHFPIDSPNFEGSLEMKFDLKSGNEEAFRRSADSVIDVIPKLLFTGGFHTVFYRFGDKEEVIENGK